MNLGGAVLQIPYLGTQGMEYAGTFASDLQMSPKASAMFSFNTRQNINIEQRPTFLTHGV